MQNHFLLVVLPNYLTYVISAGIRKYLRVSSVHLHAQRTAPGPGAGLPGHLVLGVGGSVGPQLGLVLGSLRGDGQDAGGAAHQVVHRRVARGWEHERLVSIEFIYEVICLTGHALGAVFGRNRWHGEGATQDDIKAACLPLPHHGVDQLVLLRIQSPDLASGLLATAEELCCWHREEIDDVCGQVPLEFKFV